VLKKIGWGAFLFFLIKGLIWLAIGFGGFKWISELFHK
jgi:hypothetical protein